MAKHKDWHPLFNPYYSPMEMLEMGVFEGKYINALTGLPKSWYKYKRVVGPKDPPNPELNHYGVKSRQPLSVWREKGWTTKHSPYGWFEWYCHYWLGRRLEKEDEWQIQRWQSFCARHQAQIEQSGDLKDETKRLKQRQALLQWGWKSTLPFNDSNRKLALRRHNIEPMEINVEAYDRNHWFDWHYR